MTLSNLFSLPERIDLARMVKEDGLDFFRAVAAHSFEKAPEEITQRERDLAKGAWFWVLYVRQAGNTPVEIFLRMCRGEPAFVEE